MALGEGIERGLSQKIVKDGENHNWLEGAPTLSVGRQREARHPKKTTFDRGGDNRKKGRGERPRPCRKNIKSPPEER